MLRELPLEVDGGPELQRFPRYTQLFLAGMLPFDEGRFRVARARRLEEASVRAGGRDCGEEGVGLRLVPRGLLRPREGPRLLRRLPDGEQGAALHALRAPPRAEARLRVPEAGGRREDPAARAEEEAHEHKGFYDEIAKHRGATIFIDSNGKVLAIVYADPRESAVESSLRALKTVVKLFFS